MIVSGDNMVKILFEDEHIIICEKQVGMLSEDSASDESLPNILKKLTGSEIYTLHRLDKPVGGVIMYAKTKKSAAAFSAIIADNKLEKTYLALTDGLIEKKTGEMRRTLKDSFLKVRALRARELREVSLLSFFLPFFCL